MVNVALVSLTAILAACTSGRELAEANKGQGTGYRTAKMEMVVNQGQTQAFRPQEGATSWYHEDYKTASGERFRPDGMTAAHRTLPLGTIVKVTRVDTGKSVTVRINDRGPYKGRRILDLSRGAARELDMLRCGIARCRIEVVQYPQPS